MEWWQALVLGLVEGLTEFLPVSSTGHLILAQRAMGIEESEAANAYAICIQAGAILAVTGLYRGRLLGMAQGLAGRDPAGRRMLGLLLLAFLPAAVLGPLLDELIESHLFGLYPVAAAWLVGGALIFVLKPRADGRPLEALDARTALLVGLAQCVAMWPGTSRSLAAIVGGLLCGLSLPAAVELSFLLGLVTLSAATGYSGLKHAGALFSAYGPVELLVGAVASALSAFAAVRWLVGWLQSHGLGIFGVWRIALGAGVLLALQAGWL
jgi:undecaprenyl-diphosphatase